MAANQTTNNNSISSILDKEKFNGSNFLDWYRNLRIVLRNEQKLHQLEEALPEAPPTTAIADVRNAYTRRVAEQKEVACLMLVSMTLEIQKNLEDRPAFKILQELKTMFQQQAEQELFETVKVFHACKQDEGQSVSTYVLKIKAYLDQMERLGYPMPLVLGVNMILTSLSKDYDQFVQNYNMHDMGKTIPELHAMLKLAEKGIPKKTPVVLAIRQDWTLEEELSFIFGRVEEEQSQFIWHIRGYRKLNKGALDLYVGNGHSAAVKAIGSFELILPSGMILVLDNFSKDNICYFNPFPRDGIFEIDMHNHISNERSIYTCSNKKSKHNLDSTFLWHYRLGHINKKRIEKLQHDGLLESIDNESFDVCVSCISSKMARNPFTHASERADDLVGIIHSDVCGPFRTTSREGANYYVTFTDDFSRYGYVYLIKHKHEVFEMFKTFQNEVENQLGKTIKALRSDRGEFAARILNMVPTKKVNKTPYEMWHEKVLNLSYLKVWGCEVLVKRDTPNKLESRSIKCIFVGYLKETMGYYFYYPLENKIFVSRYSEFFETRLIKQEASGSTVDFDEIQSEEAQPSENTSLHQHEVEPDTVDPKTDVILVRRSARIPQAPKRYGFYIDAEEHELGDHGEPPNYRAALSDPESKKWLEAMNAEMQSMKDNQVWILVDLPPNYKIVESKWLFKKKTDIDGNIHTYKAHLVEKRSIYGLKQASRNWNKRFDEEIKKYGFTQNPDEPCVYKRASGSIIVFLILYVDDILLMGNNIPMLQDVKSWLGKCFSMKDLGETAYILRIKIYRDRSR
ncbi:retrotransposon protein, putative, ty1-copia subclass [Tanacetum coccineum]